MAAMKPKVPGTADVFDGIVVAGPAVRIMPDFAQLAQYGLTAAGLQAELQTAIEGNVVGQIFQKGSISNIRVSYHDSSQYDLGKLRSQPVFLPGAGLIP
jgi:Cu/Ag efflux pump CusA